MTNIPMSGPCRRRRSSRAGRIGAVAAGLAALALLAAAPAGAGEAPAAGGFRRAEHPFILWTKDDLAALRRRVAAEPWAKEAYRRAVEAKKDDRRAPAALADLFRLAVEDDPAAAEREKKELLKVVRSPFPQGAAQEWTVLRYDLLYGRLSEDERRECEAVFRNYIEMMVFKRAVFDPAVFNNSANYARYDAKVYTRSNWLPNIIWPWKTSANLMAAALRDEALIRRTWEAYGSWKWYFDEYLCDTGFYAEEFSKMGSTPGAMVLYCLALERLGLGDLGFGYTGRGGATMRGHLGSVLHLGYPRVDLGASRPHYPKVTLGDLRQSGSSRAWNFPGYCFQHSTVLGYLPDGRGGDLWWAAPGAWGGTMRGQHPQWDGYSNFTPKMLLPLWLEFAQTRWPQLRCDYFLAQMRGPDEDRYRPSLLWGLAPVDPGKVEPPPAPSAVWPERGIGMLRAEESPAYWESGAPAVAFRTATPYAHSVNDAFALLGFYAFNRPLYLNRQTTRGYAKGWSRSVASHASVQVDGGEPRFTKDLSHRHAFWPPAKFAAVRSKAVHEGVDQTRALVLAREYLLDVFDLRAEAPRTYAWRVHAVGPADRQALRDAGWRETASAAMALQADAAPWSVTVTQDCPMADPKATVLGPGWYGKRIGVRLSMLGEADTVATVSDTPPLDPDPQGAVPRDEIGGTTVTVERRAARTRFVALHEPFERASPRIGGARVLAATDDALALAVVGDAGTAVNDRVLLRLGDACGDPITLDGDGERFVFSGAAFVRIGPETVEAWGDLRGLKVRAPESARLVLNGRAAASARDAAFLVFGPAP